MLQSELWFFGCRIKDNCRLFLIISTFMLWFCGVHIMSSCSVDLVRLSVRMSHLANRCTGFNGISHELVPTGVILSS